MIITSSSTCKVFLDKISKLNPNFNFALLSKNLELLLRNQNSLTIVAVFLYKINIILKKFCLFRNKFANNFKIDAFKFKLKYRQSFYFSNSLSVIFF